MNKILHVTLGVFTMFVIVTCGLLSYDAGYKEGKEIGKVEQKLADENELKELQHQLNLQLIPEISEISRDEDITFKMFKDLLDEASSVKVDLSLNSLGENHGTITIVFGEDNK